jgi:hypothetical protein
MRCSQGLVPSYANGPNQRHDQQKGALLLLTLFILLILTLLGISAVSSTNIDLQMAGNQQRQNEAELVAENAVNFLVKNYPLTTMPTSANFETFGFAMNQSDPAQSCVTKTKILESGTPESLGCTWTGDGDPHESFSGSKSCMVGDYVSTWHPHLHEMGGDRELWVNGNVTVEMCGNCFSQELSIINYTGLIINSCIKEGHSWPWKVTANKVTQAEFNEAADAGPLVGGDYYSHVEIRVTSTDPISGATATAVKGFKYRGDDSTSLTIGSPANSDCSVGNVPMSSVSEDPLLTVNGSRSVLYSYFDIDN